MVHIIYFVHGTTTDNEHELATGWLPGELSELGKQQARTLGEQVAPQHFDAVFCSDLDRAIETATVAFGPNVIRDERLREANYGDWNGQPAALFKDRMEDFIDIPFPNGESYHNVEERMRSFCATLKAKYSGQHVALVSHQAPQLALEVICNRKTWPEAIAEDWRKFKRYQSGWEYALA